MLRSLRSTAGRAETSMADGSAWAARGCSCAGSRESLNEGAAATAGLAEASVCDNGTAAMPPRQMVPQSVTMLAKPAALMCITVPVGDAGIASQGAGFGQVQNWL